MAELTVELTYATALYQAACENGTENAVKEDGEQLLQILKDNPDLEKFILSPAIAAAEKKEVLCSIFEGNMAQELVNFICILIDKGRIVHLARIIRTYSELYNHDQGVVDGTIFSVEPLSEDRMAKFEEETSKLLGETIKLDNQIDKSLIGGVKILVNGRIIDASIKSRLAKLASEIRL